MTGGVIFGFSRGSVPNGVFDLDAGLSGSYSGSGTTFANTIASPADGSLQSAYNFTLTGLAGAPDLPVFAGVAGADSPAEYFTDSGTGGAFFNFGTNTTFFNGLHKNNAAFTWVGLIKTPTTLSTSTPNYLFSTTHNTGNASSVGVAFYIGVSKDLILYAEPTTSGVPVLNQGTSSNFVANNTKYMLGISYDEATGVGLFYKNGSGGKSTSSFTQAYVSPSSSSPDKSMTIMASDTAMPTGWKWWKGGMFNSALTEAQLDSYYDVYSYKLL